jgi:nitrite reductase/ring-hydroxylating ferredoxin subunit
MLTSHRRLLQMLEPTVTAFYAGPLVLRDRINTYINAIPEACDYSGLLRDLATVGPVMWPGPFSKLTFAAQRLVQTDLVDWLEYRDRPLPTLPDDAVDHYAEPVTVEDALGSARMYACELVDAQRRLGLEITTDLLFSAVPGFDALEDGIPCWQIAVLFHSAGGEVREITPDAGIAPPFLQVVSTPKIIQLVFQNREPWESFYGGRGRLRRVPDRFDNALHLCMRYARDPLSREALRRDLTMRRRIAAQPETFTVAHGGQQYTLLRRCPHEGEDLTKAEIKDGVVVCPRHQWRFDIETGACLRGDPRCSIRTDATSSALTAAVQD